VAYPRRGEHGDVRRPGLHAWSWCFWGFFRVALVFKGGGVGVWFLLRLLRSLCVGRACRRGAFYVQRPSTL
jgi:hypothetical protein